MPLPYIPFLDTAEVVAAGFNSSDATFLTMAFQRAGGYHGSDLADLADVINAWWHSDLSARLGVAQSFNQIKVTDLSTVSGPVHVQSFTSPLVGSHAGDTVPVQVAMVVSLYTDQRGRSYRGRNYVPGLTINQLADGTRWGAVETGDMTTVYQNLVAQAGSAGFNMVVCSRFNAGARRSVGVSTLVTQVVAKQIVGTQRRRVAGHGI